MKQRIQRPVNRTYLWSLDLDWYNAQWHILKSIIIKDKDKDKEKVKKQMHFCGNLKKF